MSTLTIPNCDNDPLVIHSPHGALTLHYRMNNEVSNLNIDGIYLELLDTDLFSVYRAAFERVTAQTLSLFHPDVISTPAAEASRCKNEFCSTLLDTSVCNPSCIQQTIDLSKRIDNQAHSARCEGNITTTLIPVKAARQTVAYLRSGQVRTTEHEINETFIQKLKDNLPPQVARDILKKFEEQKTFTKEEYHSQLTLLGAFALQLSDLADTLVRNTQNTAPSGIVDTTKRFIHERLSEKIELASLAENVNVTSSYLCRQFKKTTGLTIVEYINRHRIEKAKELLTRRNSRVIEIAYETGFQSLSQFNRSFQRYAGQSPTEFKNHETPALNS